MKSRSFQYDTDPSPRLLLEAGSVRYMSGLRTTCFMVILKRDFKAPFVSARIRVLWTNEHESFCSSRLRHSVSLVPP